MRKMAILIVLAMTAACAKPAPPPDPAKTRTPVPAAELRRILPGHFIDEGNYPCDAGPLSFVSADAFVQYGGWGWFEGKYRISDGAADLLGTSGNTPQPDYRVHLRFVRDGNGALFYSGRNGSDVEFPLKLGKNDKDTRWITCGNRKAPPPPNGVKP